VWVKPPRIPVTILSSRLAGYRDTQSLRIVMRVWVALPKKAALYTMKPSSEQCLTGALIPLAGGRPRPHFVPLCT